MLKKLIYADFRKNNSIFAAAISVDQKNRGISARTPRANTAETSGRNTLPALLRRSTQADSSAGVRQAVRDIRWQHLAAQNYCSYGGFLIFGPTGAKHREN